MASLKKAAVLLSGCGVFDGTEIHESVLMLLALSNQKIAYKCFAPNLQQAHVVNHWAGAPDEKSTRNILEESTRIARKENIQEITELVAKDYDMLMIPGGFGVAKNFSNFGFQGEKFTVEKYFSEIVQQFYELKKPIGACCITPLILSKILGSYGVELTLGKTGDEWPYQETIKLAQSLGAKIIECNVNECLVDKTHKIVTSPAYLKNQPELSEVYEGLEKLVKQAKLLV